MEPSTAILTASVLIAPVLSKAIKVICHLLFQEQPNEASWRGQRLKALQALGCGAKDLWAFED